MFASSLLLSLALLPDAEAANIPKIKNVRVRQLDNNGNVSYSLTALTPDADAEVASVAGELDGQPVSLTESDAWVHGSATLSAEPADGAELTLTVYDADSAVLETFSGTYTDGVLTLTGTTRDGGGDCTARVCEEGTSSTTDLDLEVLAAVVYGDGTVGIDLAGADATGVASASLSSVESTATEECVAWGRAGECIEYGRATTRDDAELDLDELGFLWAGDVAAIDGVAELELKAYDSRGKKLDKAKVKLAAPWEDDGEGINVLPIDEDPLTTVALVDRPKVVTGWDLEKNSRFAVVSDGWALGDALPELAEIEVEGGETWSVPVNSYQVTTAVQLDVDLDTLEGLALDGDALAFDAEKKFEPIYSLDHEPCVLRLLSGADGGVWVSVTVWAADPDDLPSGVTLTTTDALGELDADVAFSDEVAVVFAMDVELASDAAGLDLLGKVKLQGAANKKGKRETLVKGKFAGRFGVDGDGEVDVSALDKTGDTVSRGDILIGGEPIDIERTGTPPVCVQSTSTGGRMNAQCTTYR